MYKLIYLIIKLKLLLNNILFCLSNKNNRMNDSNLMSPEDLQYVKHGQKIIHADHIGYLLNDKLKCENHGNTLIEHYLNHSVENCVNDKKTHTHDINLEHKIKHLDHYDIIVDNRLHHIHGDHCDIHGEVSTVKQNNKQNNILFPLMIFLIGSFFVVELVIGFIVGSLSLQSDAFHMLSDLMALIIGFYSFYMANKKRSDTATFGYTRSEIIGGLVNSIVLLTSCFFIFIDSIRRFFNVNETKNELDKNIILVIIVGIVGLVINLIGIMIISCSGQSIGHNHSHGNHSHKNSNHKSPKSQPHHTSNIKAMFVHMIGDMLGSLGVIISGLIIYFVENEWKYYMDPVISICIVGIILYGTIPITIKCIHILLHKVPIQINLVALRDEILKIKNVLNIHHFHIWHHTDHTIICTMHIICESEDDNLKNAVENILHKNGIHVTTIQFECQNNNCNNMICLDKECMDQMCCDDV